MAAVGGGGGGELTPRPPPPPPPPPPSSAAAYALVDKAPPLPTVVATVMPSTASSASASSSASSSSTIVTTAICSFDGSSGNGPIVASPTSHASFGCAKNSKLQLFDENIFIAKPLQRQFSRRRLLQAFKLQTLCSRRRIRQTAAAARQRRSTFPTFSRRHRRRRFSPITCAFRTEICVTRLLSF